MASPMQRLADGRMGYPLGGCQSCIGSPQRVVRQRVRALYPGIGDVGVERYVQSLVEMRGGLFENLLRVEQQYRRLDDSLLAWVERRRAPLAAHADELQIRCGVPGRCVATALPGLSAMMRCSA